MDYLGDNLGRMNWAYEAKAFFYFRYLPAAQVLHPISKFHLGGLCEDACTCK